MRPSVVGDWAIVEIRRLEDHALIVAFTLTLAFDAILADRSLFAALDTTLTTGQASRLGPFPRELSLQRLLRS